MTQETDHFGVLALRAGMIAALYLLCSSYIFFVDDRRLLMDPFRLAKLLTVMVLASTYLICPSCLAVIFPR